MQLAAVYRLMPDILVADLPEDYDPCDMVKEGLGDQLYWQYMKAKNYIPDGFVKYEQFKVKAQELPTLGLPLALAHNDKIIIGA